MTEQVERSIIQLIDDGPQHRNLAREQVATREDRMNPGVLGGLAAHLTR